jgi:hypothetical protein
MKDTNTNILQDIPFQPSTLETVDFALYDFLQSLDLYTTTNTGWRKIDVIWVSAERAFQTKEKKERRLKDGTVNYPLITLSRDSVTKSLSHKGTAYANIPAELDPKGGSPSITIARRINQDKTSNFVNAETKRVKGQINFPRKSKKIVYQTISIPMPAYIDVMYTIKLETLYQQQMNELLQPFITKTGGINYQVIRKDGHLFEAFIQEDFANNSNVKELGSDERKYETEIHIKVLAYLIGLDKNQEQPKIVIRENAVEVKTPREHIIFGDIPDFKTKQNYIGMQGINNKKSTS